MVFLAARKDDSNMNLIIIIDKLNHNKKKRPYAK